MKVCRTCLRRQTRPRPTLLFQVSRRHGSFLNSFLKGNDPQPAKITIPGVQSIPTCPEPTGTYGQPPIDRLDIDRKSQLFGTMAPHKSQIVVCTGDSRWQSKIENSPYGWVARGLKEELKPGGVLSKHAPALVTFANYTKRSQSSIDFYLFPAFRYVTIDTEAIAERIVDIGSVAEERAIIKKMAKILDAEMSGHDDSGIEAIRETHGVLSLDIHDIHVLICGHEARDKRCGSLGKPLRSEFEAKLRDKHINIVSTPACDEDLSILGRPVEVGPFESARVGLISHIGGHKFAGNVILRFPPLPVHPLSGMEIWYGRVEPKHVEGIVEETIGGGRVIQELLRGIKGNDSNAFPVEFAK